MFRLINLNYPCGYNKQHLFTVCIQKFILCRSLCVRYKSFYDTLGLDATATAKDIKTAYYELSLKHHPDRNEGSQESVDKFREITEAYEILIHPEKKKMYDASINSHPQYSDKDAAKFYRASQYRRSNRGPYTGKSKDFNYDEHYRKHYEEIKKQKEIELEYFRRRWEANFYRRYPSEEEYYRNRHKQKEYSYEDFSERMPLFKFTVCSIILVWCVIMFIQFYTTFYVPEKKLRSYKIYYKVFDDDSDNSEKKE